ncbi:MAG: C4-dicarboxylate ABC transporter [Alphaproteobacteria bacterium]|nr:MAG: C4-dicarboxylate ABC transporter [Alphaproteobacteria bacterium]
MTFYRKLTLVVIIVVIFPVFASAEIVLRLAENQPEVSPVTKSMHYFSRLVERYTQGQIIVKIYAGGQFGQEPENIEQAQFGIVDFARVNSVVVANVSPSMGVFTLPYIFRDRRHKYAVLDGEIGKEVMADLSHYGLVGFDYMESGTRNIYTVEGKVIERLEDLKGMKIRVQPAPISLRMMELLGAIPTPMNYGEVFSSLQTGVIDGAENDFVSYHSSGHFEVAPNYVLDGHLSVPALLLMNKKRFLGLSLAHQKAIKQAAHDAALYERELMFEANKKARIIVEAAGSIVKNIDNGPFQKAISPIYDEFPSLRPLIKRIQAIK